MYNPKDIAERIKKATKAKGVTIKKLLEDVGLGFNTMSNMRTSVPKADNLAKIADYLDVPVDYLLGRDKFASGAKTLLTEDEGMRLYEALDIEDRAETRGMMKHMLTAEKYSEKEELKKA